MVVAFAACFATIYTNGFALEYSGQCDLAAQNASAQTGVPFEILAAITRAETGKAKDGQTIPWPWAINENGKGFWFDQPSDAIKHAQSTILSGKTNIDIGCFQLNYRWHGNAFPSIESMISPKQNALYAAHFLKDLHQETQNWLDAAALYHSRTPRFASRYRKRVQAFLTGDLPVKRVQKKAGRENRFPLLKVNNEHSKLGSLVPAITSQRTHWFGG